MSRLLNGYMIGRDRVLRLLAGPACESAALLLTRFALAGVFWRSGRTKVESGTALTLNDSTYALFEYEYTGLPLPADLAAPLATYAEHLFPVLLVLGLATRLSALALFGMTMVIQIFVYPEAWWTVHSLWVAMALVLVARGGGLVALDAGLKRWLGRRAIPLAAHEPQGRSAGKPSDALG